MRAERAIQALEELHAEATDPNVLKGGQGLTSWRNKTRGVIKMAVPDSTDLLEQFDRVRYTLTMASAYTPQSDYDMARHMGVDHACGIIDAALYRLRLHLEDESPRVWWRL